MDVDRCNTRTWLLRRYCPVLLVWFIQILVFGFIEVARGQESQWPVQRVVGPFHFHCDVDRGECEQYSVQLSQLRDDLQTALGVECKVDKIHLVILQTESDYQKYIKHYFPQLPTRRALYIQDRGPGIVFAFQHSETLIDLRHECTHALLQDRFAKLPLWLDEGIAEYFENEPGSRDNHSVHLPIAIWQAKLGHVPPMEKLELCLTPQQMDARKYSDAWAWVNFLLSHSDRSRHVFKSYLEEVSAWGAKAGSLSARVRESLPYARDAYLDHYLRIAVQRDSVRLSSAP